LDIGFRCSLLLNFFIIYLIMIYTSYEISLRNFERIRAAVGKLYFIGTEWLDIGFRCNLLLNFIIVYLITVYSSYEISL
jgi:hypothetical protein